MNAEKTTISEIGSDARNLSIRHSLQQQPKQDFALKTSRLTQTHTYGQKKRSSLASSVILGVPSIPETSEEESIAPQEQYVKNTRSSVSKNRRRSSQISGKSINSTRSNDGTVSVGVFENPAFETNDEDGLQRTVVLEATRSRSSVPSLQIQKEQYCCFSRWSRCERRLFTCVGVLAIIIICLVTAVSWLAVTKGRPEADAADFYWSP